MKEKVKVKQSVNNLDLNKIFRGPEIIFIFTSRVYYSFLLNYLHYLFFIFFYLEGGGRFEL